VKILWVVDCWTPAVKAGAEVMAHELSRALVVAGHRVHVCHRADRHAPASSVVVDGVVIHHFDDALMLRSMQAADLVFTQCLPSVISQIHATARMMHKPVAMLLHSDFPQVVSVWRNSRPELTVFNSRWMRDAFLRYRQDFTYVVVNPINRFPVDPTPPGEKITLVNLTHAKGVDIFAEVAKAMPDEQFLGVVGGYGSQRLLLGENTVTHPATDDMGSVYRQSKLVMMPSRYESWGLVAMEAASFGRPSVVRRTPGLLENVEDSGVVVDTDDPAAWVEGVRLALDGYSQLSVSAIARATELHALTTERLAAFVSAVESFDGV